MFEGDLLAEFSHSAWYYRYAKSYAEFGGAVRRRFFPHEKNDRMVADSSSPSPTRAQIKRTS